MSCTATPAGGAASKLIDGFIKYIGPARSVVTSSAFTQPAVGGSVTVNIGGGTSTFYKYQYVYIPGGGDYQITGVDLDVAHAREQGHRRRAGIGQRREHPGVRRLDCRMPQ